MYCGKNIAVCRYNILFICHFNLGMSKAKLFHLLDMLDRGAPRPAAVIGVPVGFVGAAESKEALAADGRVPFLVVRGRKGGSAMAVAAVNALASDAE